MNPGKRQIVIQRFQNPTYQESARRYIAIAQAKAGKYVEAKKISDLIQDTLDRSLAQFEIAAAQSNAKDIAEAMQTAELIQHDYLKGWAQRIIAEKQKWIAAVNPGNADDQITPATSRQRHAIFFRDWTNLNERSHQLNEPIFLNPGDVLKTLPSTDPQKTFDALLGAARKLVDVSAGITGSFKQQATQ
jgi:hypothetical protein